MAGGDMCCGSCRFAKKQRPRAWSADDNDEAGTPAGDRWQKTLDKENRIWGKYTLRCSRMSGTEGMLPKKESTLAYGCCLDTTVEAEVLVTPEFGCRMWEPA